MANFLIDDISLKMHSFDNKIVSIDQLLNFCSENDCSDLYIKIGQNPYISRYGRVMKLPCLPTNNIIWNEWAKIAVSSERNAEYVRQKMLDFAYEITIPEESKFFGKYDKFRYRVTIGFSNEKNIATFRMIRPNLPSFENINFEEKIKEKLESAFAKRNGIVIINGPTGSGKSIFHKQEVEILRKVK